MFLTLHIYFSASPCLPAPPPASLDQSSYSKHLSISIWHTYPTHAVIDWYITMAEKDCLTNCDMTYAATEDDKEKPKVVENFIPVHRTFSIGQLTQNTSYWVFVVCRDKGGGWHASHTIHFTTAEVYGARYSPLRQVMQAMQDKRNMGVLRVRKKEAVSPHTLMGKIANT